MSHMSHVTHESCHTYDLILCDVGFLLGGCGFRSDQYVIDETHVDIHQYVIDETHVLKVINML